MEKGRRMESEKGKFELGLLHQKLYPLSLYSPQNSPICHLGLFCNFIWLNETMVCGVSVNSKTGYLPLV